MVPTRRPPPRVLTGPEGACPVVSCVSLPRGENEPDGRSAGCHAVGCGCSSGAATRSCATACRSIATSRPIRCCLCWSAIGDLVPTFPPRLSTAASWNPTQASVVGAHRRQTAPRRRGWKYVARTRQALAGSTRPATGEGHRRTDAREACGHPVRGRSGDEAAEDVGGGRRPRQRLSPSRLPGSGTFPSSAAYI